MRCSFEPIICQSNYYKPQVTSGLCKVLKDLVQVMIIFSKGKENPFSSPCSFPFSGRWRFVWNYPVFVTFSLSIDYTVQSWVVWTQVPNSTSAYLLYSSLKNLCSNWVSEMHDIGNFQGKKIASKYSLPSLLRWDSCWS